MASSGNSNCKVMCQRKMAFPVLTIQPPYKQDSCYALPPLWQFGHCRMRAVLRSIMFTGSLGFIACRLSRYTVVVWTLSSGCFQAQPTCLSCSCHNPYIIIALHYPENSCSFHFLFRYPHISFMSAELLKNKSTLQDSKYLQALRGRWVNFGCISFVWEFLKIRIFDP